MVYKLLACEDSRLDQVTGRYSCVVQLELVQHCFLKSKHQNSLLDQHFFL